MTGTYSLRRPWRTLRWIVPALLTILGATACDVPRDDVEISVFFTYGEQPHAVARTVAADGNLLSATIEQLLQGPTPAEREAGISSWFSAATEGMLNRAIVDDEGHALIDFGDFRRVIPGASSAAGSEALLRELNSTVAQFEDVRSVEYQIEGSCHRFWAFLQRACGILNLDEQH